MKYFLAGAACLISGSAAWAQDSVRIYGFIDEAITYSKAGADSVVKLQDGPNAASRFGFRASEDLGGGLKADIWLEAGFNADTGTGTIPGPDLAFTRQSNVGLSGQWGNVRVGRMFTPLFYSMVRADPFALNALYSALNLVNAIDGQPGLTVFAPRSDNMLRYNLVSKSGLLLDVAYAPGEAPSPNRSGQFYGANVGWTSDLFYLSYGFQRRWSGSGTAPVAAPTMTQHQAISGYYNVASGLRVSANLMRGSYSVGSVPAALSQNINLEWTQGLSRLVVGVSKRKVSGSPVGQSLAVLGYDYNLSTRTALYARALLQNNNAGSSTGAAGMTVRAGSGDDIQSYSVGVRHTF